MPKKIKENWRENRRKKRLESAKKLNRPGYWSCWNCTAHNEKENKKCKVCGAKRNGDAGHGK